MMRRLIPFLVSVALAAGFSPAAKADGPTAAQLQGQFASGAVAPLSPASIGAVASSGGDVSGTNLTVTGGAISRRMADRFTPSTLDYAAPVNTSADASGSIQALEEYFRSTASGRGPVWFDPGSYTLAGTVFNPSGSMFIIPPGADVSGGAMVGITDASVILPGHGGYVIGQHDQTHGGFNISLQRDNEDDSSSPAYEEGTLYLRSRNYSESASGVTHDMVNLEAQCEIASGNMSGRCWGADALITANPGSDGYLVGYEVGMQNNSGNAAGAYGTITAKLGLHIVASGNAASTAGVIVASAGSKFSDGYAAVASALGVNFLDLIGGGFTVDKAGNVTAASIVNNGYEKFAGAYSTGDVQIADGKSFVIGPGIYLFHDSSLKGVVLLNNGHREVRWPDDGSAPVIATAFVVGTP